ncbi:SRPBCC family protein [Streptomyces sp. NPDC002577]
MDPASFTPSPPAEVECQAGQGRWILVFTRGLRHPPRTVWDALTEPAQLAAWAPYTADRNLTGTGPLTLTMIDDVSPQDMAAEVLRAEPPTLLEYTWGTDQLRWELETSGIGTRLTLRHSLQDRAWVPRVAAGWHLCLDVAERLLDGQPIQPIRGAAAGEYGWLELNDAYAETLGIPSTGWPEGMPEDDS